MNLSNGNKLKRLALLTMAVLSLIGCNKEAQIQTETEAPAVVEVSETEAVETEESEAEKEIEPAYGENNGMALIELSDTKPEVAPVPVNNEPNRIATNLTEDPSSSMAFNWFTTDKVEDSVVRLSTSEDMIDPIEFPAEIEEVTSEYAERDANGFYIYASITMNEDDEFIVDDKGQPEEILGYFTDEQITRENTKWTADGDELGYLFTQDVQEHIYKAEATGLEANTQYYYQLGSESQGFSEVGSFRTASTEAEDFTFIQYTDTQNAYWNANINNEAAYGANVVEKALETVPDADFALHTGDFVEIAQLEDEWVDNLDMSRESNLNLPHAYTPGNHDEYTLKYLDYKDVESFNNHTNVPITNNAVTGGSYYSYDYNGAHFVILNTNDNKASDDNPDEGAIGKEQMEWAKADIQAARDNGANWIILAYHKPVYSASYHSLQDTDVQVIREEFVKLADELDVDIVLQGHDHNLTRTKSLLYTNENFSYGKVEDTEKREIDGVEYHVNPQGVTYVIPNNSGTKTYDAIYQKGSAHVAKVRPKLDWITDADIDIWNALFDIAKQPESCTKFQFNHDNYRQSTIQNFAAYTVTPDTFKIEFYQVEGDLHKGEDRVVNLIDSYGIIKE